MKCEKVLFPEFPNLRFGKTFENHDWLVDATILIQSSSETGLSIEGFFQKFDYQIQAMYKSRGINPNAPALVNQDGHHIIHGCLCFLLVQYTDPQFVVYCDAVINDLLTTGFVMSDSTLISYVSKRLTPDVLVSIANGRS